MAPKRFPDLTEWVEALQADNYLPLVLLEDKTTPGRLAGIRAEGEIYFGTISPRFGGVALVKALRSVATRLDALWKRIGRD